MDGQNRTPERMVNNMQSTGMENHTNSGQHQQLHEGQPLEGAPQFPDVQQVKNFTGQSETIFPDGDLYVVLLDFRNTMLAGFRVSSQICRVASPPFAKLIDTQVSRQDGCKFIFNRLLPGSWRSDSQALRCILSVLHHTNKDQYMKLDIGELLRVSETNLLMKSLQTIIDGEQPSVVELGMLLKSADNFEAKDELVKLRQFAIRNLPMHFREIWARHPPLLTLENCKSLDGLQFDVNKRLVRACSHIWSFEGLLDTQSEGYITDKRLCLSCGRRHPSNAKLCHLCLNGTLYDDVCTKNSRVGEYFRILALQTLWPTNNILNPDDATLSTISQRVNDLASRIPHTCSGGSKCPLIVHIGALQGHLKRTMDDCTRSNNSVNLGSTTM
ncbi:hypothetical protein CNYM01_07737 [Colletotrichum nymphaeae SA-01]|uniref:Uncharacterized protein n=1 Tax=Colletotrichum nymphaeae SA-01 TaxID=1460502 RepID=A0A135TBL1_9PEZI|nr:hypothetical protein CNYM01_07737 [Colletotrichum nymphaeae SA-01]